MGVFISSQTKVEGNNGFLGPKITEIGRRGWQERNVITFLGERENIMNNLNITPEYKEWFVTLKSKIRSVQIKAALAVSSALIEFYWDLGRMISEKDAVWGSRFLESLSKDLKNEFPDIQGFSVTNLKYCRLFYHYISIGPQVGDETTKLKSPQAGDETGLPSSNEIYQHIKQIPWGHIKLLMTKVGVH
jgi:hypothetical protein